jgi:molybdenum cofactor cytidylyltransferase
MSVVAVVLAAGASRRFGSPKLLAPLDGRPVLAHTLDAVAAAGIRDVVVVLGESAAAAEASIAWRGERRVVNPRPQDGLASSLRCGLDVAAEAPLTDAVLVVLGDQPAVRAAVIRSIVEAAADPAGAAHPFVRARYADDPAPNPVLVRRSGWALAAGIDGDRGLGSLLASRPDLVLEVPVPGDNPDIDTPDDLAVLAGRVAGGTEVRP